MKDCKCGKTPFVVQTIECSLARYFIQCECGEQTHTWSTPTLAEAEWDSMMAVCPEIEAAKTIVDELFPSVKRDEELLHNIQSKVHGQGNPQPTDKSPLEGQLDGSEDELLGMYKLTEKGEMLARHIEAENKAAYWFEKHNEVEEELKDLENKYSYELSELSDEIKYWTGEYNKVVQENEKYKMAFDRLWDIVEDMK